MKTRRIIIGICTWTGLAIAACVGVQSQFADKPQGPTETLTGIARWLSGSPQEHIAESATDIILASGDPIFLKMPDGQFRQVGRVRDHFWRPPAGSPPPKSSITEAWTRRASVVLYDDAVEAVFPDGYHLEYHTTPTALDWVATTLITPERQQRIAELIARDWQTHREKIMAQLQPVLETSIAKAVTAIEAELPTVLSAHRADFARLADRYQTEIIRSQIVPLVRSEILPIVQEEAQPLATELSRDLWDRVSLWSFTWRYLYDVSPLPEKNAVKLEFDRFMKEEITPALEARSEEFVALTERILRRISRNEKVRSVIRENLKKVATDSELQSIVLAIVNEAVINNQTLRASLREYWDSAEVREAMAVASSSFEPTARAIGDTIFGNREDGVTPEFARVLRAQILMKDRRWFVIVPKPSVPPVLPQPNVDGLIMTVATTPMPFPLQFEGTAQSPLSQLQTPAAAP